MRQQQINLLPDSVRQQCEAGARTGRLVASIALGILFIVIAATHSRLQLDRVRSAHQAAQQMSEEVQASEREAAGLIEELKLVNDFIASYERLAMPLDISALVSTIINSLPSSVTLESIDLEAGERRSVRINRVGSGSDSSRMPRVVVGELTGFARSDEEIAELESLLRANKVFDAVTTDFSRTRNVRNISAREFRMSFRVNLDAPFVVNERPMTAGVSTERVE